jgi:hypothetical protein
MKKSTVTNNELVITLSIGKKEMASFLIKNGEYNVLPSKINDIAISTKNNSAIKNSKNTKINFKPLDIIYLSDINKFAIFNNYSKKVNKVIVSILKQHSKTETFSKPWCVFEDNLMLVKRNNRISSGFKETDMGYIINPNKINNDKQTTKQNKIQNGKKNTAKINKRDNIKNKNNIENKNQNQNNTENIIKSSEQDNKELTNMETQEIIQNNIDNNQNNIDNNMDNNIDNNQNSINDITTSSEQDNKEQNNI